MSVTLYAKISMEIELEETCKYRTIIICETVYIITNNTFNIHYFNSFLVLFRYSNHATIRG